LKGPHVRPTAGSGRRGSVGFRRKKQTRNAHFEPFC
jgi:hypothetical protein